MLDKILKMQEKLDKKILLKFIKKVYMPFNIVEVSDEYYHFNEELLTKTILAMQVELSEFANETRCFKHWSTKGLKDMDREKALEEYIDVLHFFSSIANQLEFTSEDIMNAYEKKNKINYERQRDGY